MNRKVVPFFNLYKMIQQSCRSRRDLQLCKRDFYRISFRLKAISDLMKKFPNFHEIFTKFLAISPERIKIRLSDFWQSCRSPRDEQFSYIRIFRSGTPFKRYMQLY